MLVRRYKGRNEEEAVAKAKADLGPDAVILYKRELKKDGILDLSSAAKVEVIVAVDQDFHSEHPDLIRRGKMEGGRGKGKSKGTIPHTSHLSSAGGFRAYAISAYSTVKETPEQIREASQPPGMCLGAAAEKLYKHLLSHEVQEEVAVKLSLSIQELIGSESSLTLQEAMNVCIEELVRTSGGLNIEERPAVVAFVGPTGVGKTTTIAKLAAHYHLKEAQKISLITVDTYRIAAIEQLKTYATYIGVPLEVALSPQEMHQLLMKYKNSDLILIDTPGRSQKDSMRIQELKMILSAARPTEVHLLLNVTTQRRILWDIIRGYSALGANRLLFTKLDESISFGNILNLSVALGEPISYLTTGQDVPDDIQLATIERITEYLLREEDAHYI